MARNLIVFGVGALVFMGLFAGILRSPMLQHELTSDVARELFASNGLRMPGVILLLGMVLLVYLAMGAVQAQRALRTGCPRRRSEHPAVVIPAGAIALLIVLLLPLGFTGLVPSVIALVALYALMGLGLNITLGLAGLLDLGFVAFFAVGAYTIALLTSAGRRRHRRAAVHRGHPLRHPRGHGLRPAAGPAHPGHPRRLPGHRHPGLRRDHRHPGADPIC